MSWNAGLANMAEGKSIEIAERMQQELLAMREENLARVRGEIDVQTMKEKGKLRSEWSKVGQIPGLWQNAAGETISYSPRGGGGGGGSGGTGKVPSWATTMLDKLRGERTALAKSYAEAEDPDAKATLGVLLDDVDREYQFRLEQFGFGMPGGQQGGGQQGPVGFGGERITPNVRVGTPKDTIGTEAKPLLSNAGGPPVAGEQPKPTIDDAFNEALEKEPSSITNLWSGEASKPEEKPKPYRDLYGEENPLVRMQSQARLGYERNTEAASSKRKAQAISEAEKAAPILLEKGYSEDEIIDYTEKRYPELGQENLESLRSGYTGRAGRGKSYRNPLLYGQPDEPYDKEYYDSLSYKLNRGSGRPRPGVDPKTGADPRDQEINMGQLSATARRMASQGYSREAFLNWFEGNFPKASRRERQFAIDEFDSAVQ